MDKDDSSTVISEMTVSEAEKLIEDGIIAGGMLPKIKNCMDAIKMVYQEFIFLTEGFHIVFFLKSLQIKVSVRQF